MPKLTQSQTRAIIQYYSVGALYRLSTIDPLQFHKHPQADQIQADILIALGLYETLMFSMADHLDLSEPIRVMLDQ